jgi:hypothetical protein
MMLGTVAGTCPADLGLNMDDKGHCLDLLCLSGGFGKQASIS